MAPKKNPITSRSRDGLISLAKRTGLPLGDIIDLAEGDELRSLFDTGRVTVHATPTNGCAPRQATHRPPQKEIVLKPSPPTPRAATPTIDREHLTTGRRVEMRAAGGSRAIGGYASVFNSNSQNLGGFVENEYPHRRGPSRAATAGPVSYAVSTTATTTCLAQSAPAPCTSTVDDLGLQYIVQSLEARYDILNWWPAATSSTRPSPSKLMRTTGD